MPVREQVGPYRVLKEIGVGGMGEVSLALDPKGRTVAVKVLHPAVARDEVSRRRLEREVATMRQVRSPNVAEVMDADLTASRPYIVTRYVQGRSLEETVRDQGPLRGAELTRVARGLARALDSIHEAGVVHRDLKPGNVILVDGEPVVIDFGLAHALDATRLTRTGTAIGTPGYLAPEILDGERAGPAADVFSWAATVVFAATGRSPYGAGPPQAVFSRVLRGRHDLSGVPQELVPAVRAALALAPGRRPLAAGLLESTAPPPAPPRRAPVPPRRPGIRRMPLWPAVVPALCYLVPVPALGGLLAGFAVAYAKDAGRRVRGRLAAADGGWAQRVRVRLAALVAMPLELAVRLVALGTAFGAGYVVLLALGRLLLPMEPIWSLPAGILAVVAVGLRAGYTTGAAGPLRLLVPVLAAALLVAAVMAGGPFWWPLPGVVE